MFKVKILMVETQKMVGKSGEVITYYKAHFKDDFQHACYVNTVSEVHEGDEINVGIITIGKDIKLKVVK